MQFFEMISRFSKFEREWLLLFKKHLDTMSGGELLISENIPRILRQDTINKKRAAVFIPLCNQHNEPSVLLTVRSQSVGSHKGEVSFPGGHIEEFETIEDAAIRETVEELGIDKTTLEILGVCQTVPSIHGTLVTPVIGFINEDVRYFEKFKPNPVEVHSVFTRSLGKMLDPSYRTTEMLRRKVDEVAYEMPIFGQKGDSECIWGLTALILASVIDRGIKPISERLLILGP